MKMVKISCLDPSDVKSYATKDVTLDESRIYHLDDLKMALEARLGAVGRMRDKGSICER